MPPKIQLFYGRRCRNCGQSGHNTAGCQNPSNGRGQIMTRAEQHLYESRGLLTIPIGRVGKTILPTSLVEFNRMRKKSKMSNLPFDRLGLNQDISSAEESSDASYSSSSSDGESLTSLPPEQVDSNLLDVDSNIVPSMDNGSNNVEEETNIEPFDNLDDGNGFQNTINGMPPSGKNYCDTLICFKW